jgi:DNA-directed RNA polymerase specialized sigma24 family protein
MPRPPKSTEPGKKFVGKYYLTNATLLPEVIKSKKEGKITNELARMLMLLTERYSKSSQFGGYTYREDMVSEALINLCQNALKFNPEKSSNPFAFYTTAIRHSFLQYLNNEKKHRNIRDKMLLELGENPSFNYLEQNKFNPTSTNSDNTGLAEVDPYHEEISQIKEEIVEANERKTQLELLELNEEDNLQNEQNNDIIKDKVEKEFFKYEG